LYDYLLELLFKLIEKLNIPEEIKLKNEVFVDSSFVPALGPKKRPGPEKSRKNIFPQNSFPPFSSHK
jgi:hypothetical protein